ncbi:hypothetical protein F4774DRAFT_385170 [Daldinia eschscholtzii]|nr:hypothetical protein F4774DRAFT_385170 [Daldinia eschscholtzii]
MQVTVTPAIRTVSSTVAVTTTGLTTKTTTQTVTNSAELPKRRLERHEIVDVLLGRAINNNNGPKTIKPTSIPAYASSCASSAAYESACSCIGVTPTTITAPTPSTTQVVQIVETATVAVIQNPTKYVNGSSLLGNSTNGKFGNLTASFLNVTGSGSNSSLSTPLTSSSSLISGGSTASTDKHKLKRPSAVEHTSSAGSGVDAGTITAPGTLSSSFILNSTTSLNTAAGPSAVSNSTTGIGKFLKSTSTTARASITSGTGLQSGSTGIINALRNITAAANITASPARLSNTTAPVPFMNITNTSSSKLNNTTLAPFLNSTRILPLINGTNATTVRFANTSTTATLPPTSTPSAVCSTLTNPPFHIRVSQPNGLFNGWFLQISGTGVLFTPSSSLASLFTFSSSPSSNSSTAQQHQHLCSIPLSNNDGAPIPTPADNSTAATAAPVVAIAESRPDSPGSAVYFVEPRVLEDMDNDRQGWYAPLECDPSGASERSNTASTLSCAQGDKKKYWVGCGLGLDITSDGDGTAVIDGWNCTGVGLTIEYTDS